LKWLWAVVVVVARRDAAVLRGDSVELVTTGRFLLVVATVAQLVQVVAQAAVGAAAELQQYFLTEMYKELLQVVEVAVAVDQKNQAAVERLEVMRLAQ
jgi:hypothetical protein